MLYWKFTYKLVFVCLLGNPYPPLHYAQNFSNRNMIHNVLLEEAKKQYRAEKYEEMAKQMESSLGSPVTENDIDVADKETVNCHQEDIKNEESNETSISKENDNNISPTESDRK